MTWRANLLILPLLTICLPYLAGIALLIPMSLRQPGGWGFATYFEIFGRPDYLGALFNTFWIAFVVALISAPIGLAAGLFLVRRKSHRGLWLSLILLPWVVSVVVRTYGWIVLISNRGLINWLLLQLDMTPLKLMFDPSGVIIGLVHVLSPFVALSVLGTALHQDPALEEAAASLGAKPARRFANHLAAADAGLADRYGPGVPAGLRRGGDADVLGGIRARMIGQQIYQDIFQLFDFTKASAFSVILLAATLIIACALFGFLRLWERGIRPETAQCSVLRGWVLPVLFAAVIAFFLLPLLTIVVISFTPGAYFRFPIEGFSLRWYETVLTDTRWLTASSPVFCWRSSLPWRQASPARWR